MSEIVQRVARALYAARTGPGGYRSLARPFDDLDRFDRDFWMMMARTAIDAMRPPTSQMVMVGADEVSSAKTPEGIAFRSWVAMIDEALGDREGNGTERPQGERDKSRDEPK